MSRIKEYPSITSFDGNNDALAIEQTDGASNRTRKVTPAQLKQYMEAGDFEATGEVKDGHGNILKDMAKNESGTVTSILFDTNRIAVSSQNIKYRKIGNIVTVYGDVTFGAKVTTSGNYINAGRLPFISSIQSIVSGKIVCDTGTTTPYEAVSKGGTNSIWFSYNGTNEMQTTYFENKKFHLYLTYVVS